jgi:uncharacterized protein
MSIFCARYIIIQICNDYITTIRQLVKDLIKYNYGQTHLPTQETQKNQKTWFSFPYGDQNRPKRSQASPSHRQKTPHYLACWPNLIDSLAKTFFRSKTRVPVFLSQTIPSKYYSAQLSLIIPALPLSLQLNSTNVPSLEIAFDAASIQFLRISTVNLILSLSPASLCYNCLMRKLFLLSIRFYQKYLSFLNGPNTCRFTPRCSEYTYQAIDKYGILRGTILGARRILRCHPGSPAGSDPLL